MDVVKKIEKCGNSSGKTTCKATHRPELGLGSRGRATVRFCQ